MQESGDVGAATHRKWLSRQAFTAHIFQTGPHDGMGNESGQKGVFMCVSGWVVETPLVYVCE